MDLVVWAAQAVPVAPMALEVPMVQADLEELAVQEVQEASEVQMFQE